MTRMNHDKLARRDMARPERELYSPNRKTKTTKELRAKLEQIGQELGRSVTIPVYEDTARTYCAPSGHLATVNSVAAAFRDWQRSHPDRVKVPGC